MGRDLDFSRIIRNERRRRDLTQQQLGQRVGVSDSYIAHIESGLKVPSLDVTMALANVFGFSVQQQQALLDALESSRVTRSTSRIRTRGLAVRGALRTLGRRGEGSLRLLGADDGAERGTLPTSGQSIELLSLSADGRWIAGADDRGQVILWDVERSGLVANLGGELGAVTALAFIPRQDRLLAASGGPAISVWATDTGKQLDSIESGLDEIVSLAGAADSSRFAAGDAGGWIALHDVGGDGTHRLLEAHTSEVTCMAFQPDGSRLATGGADATVRLVNIEEARVERRLEHDDGVVCVCFSSDGELLASATAAGGVTEWDAGEGTRIRELDTAGEPVLALGFRPDGLTLVAVTADGTIRSWDMRKGSVRHSLVLEDAPLDALALSADGMQVAVFDPKARAESDEFDPQEIARELATDRDLMDAFKDLKTAMARPGLRSTVMTTLRALARSSED